MEPIYQVKKIDSPKSIQVQVPGSKSITNRALMLAALSDGLCVLSGVLFSDDSRAFLDCLDSLGFEVTIEEEKKIVSILGLGGKIPNRNARINVRSAGTAARFLTVMLAFAGGDYTLESSEQMKKRPMEPLLSVLRQAGVIIHCLEEEGHFPFQIHSSRIHTSEVAIDTDLSSQFASALIMASVLLKDGLTVKMLGSRTEGSYIKITLEMMKQFGIPVTVEASKCHISYNNTYHINSYEIEPDVSGACYFYAMAPLLNTSVTVKNVHLNSLQGDIQLLKVLEQLGCELEDKNEGICLTSKNSSYPGITVNMKDFSDQTMTLSVLAPFATSPTLIKNIGHIRFQESNRMAAINQELTKLGIRCEISANQEDLCIYPGEIKPATIETYEDHRMAMAFTLIGLKTGSVQISNPSCCKKTFENYFDIIDSLTK